MFQWLSTVLHWRQTATEVTRGTQTQFIPYEGVYVVARQYDGCTSMTILNGKRTTATMHVGRYAEVIGQHKTATNIVTGETVALDKDIELAPRDALIIEF